MLMRWIGAIALLAAGCVLTSQYAWAAEKLTGQQRADAAGRSLVGSLAPKLVLRTIDGDTINLGDLCGKKAVYLKFWATWCVPCRQQMPHFQRTFEIAGADLAVIAIDSGFNDSLEDVRAARRELGIAMPVVLDDGQAGAAFNLRVTPQHVVIGRDGRIQYVGYLADAKLDAAVAAARAGTATGLSPQTANASINTPRYGVGDPLPDMSVATIDGNTFHMRDSGEKIPTVLVFISPWCESYLATSRPGMSQSCRDVRAQVDALFKQGMRIRWLAVASGLWATKDDLIDYRTQYQTAIPLTLDESGTMFRSFRIMNVPTVVIADKNGEIVRRIDGFDTRLSADLKKIVGE